MDNEQPLKTSDEQVSVKKPNKKKDKKKKTVGQEILSWVMTILAALVIACLIRAFIFEPIRVDGHSMDHTLANGEVVICTKYDYLLGAPERGDIVICRYPGRNEKFLDLGANLSLTKHTLFVKRLVALPGDTIAITDGKLYVNGDLVPDPEQMGSAPRGNFPGYTLRDDEYFVMGDNRGNSNDSRYVGPLSRDAIMGHVRFVLLPFNKIHSVK